MGNPEEPVVVIGGGIAGLATALSLAPLPVTIISDRPIVARTASAWAQGGVAAAVGDGDTPARHAADTLAAGAGLCDPAIADAVARAAPEAIERLTRWGVAFDRGADHAFALGLEAAHSRRRILHAGGDGSGRAIVEALLRTARHGGSIEVIEGVRARRLLAEDGRVTGLFAEQEGRSVFLPARAVVLATGGLGGLYASTTNPRGADGSGLALAARVGAVLRDVEFVQFHPTGIAVGIDPMPLASEAIRGEGAVLVDDRGEAFMAGVPGRELAPRDVVARAVQARIDAGRRVFLDAREAIGARFPEGFPTVAALCRRAGLDPASQPIPVRPAAHYHMGGLRVDARGRTSVEGLWACGEVAATGLHGANRLASNSLVEAVVCAGAVAADIAGIDVRGRRRPTLAVAEPAGHAMTEPLDDIRRMMGVRVGVIRDAAGLREAVSALAEIAFAPGVGQVRADAALAGLFVAVAALRRAESRGAHFRSDHPEPDPALCRHSDLTLGDVAATVLAEAPDLRLQTGPAP